MLNQRKNIKSMMFLKANPRDEISVCRSLQVLNNNNNSRTVLPSVPTIDKLLMLSVRGLSV